jgi:4-hydroxybenzoate polyprenyltransferase
VTARPTVAASLGLARACHPLPAVAVTAFGTALAVAAGAGAARAVLVAAARLTGQLSIGWLNDAVDAPLDADAGRADKPVVAGQVDADTVRVAAVAALVATVPLSLALGPVPGLLHLVLVASGWAYDLRLKGTVLSPLPYLVAFGALPAVAATAAGARVPVLLASAAGVLAVAAHFANTVADAEADALTGVRGLPQRLGPGASRWVAAAGVVAASLVPLVGAWPELPWASAGLLVAAGLLGAAGGALTERTAFRVVLAAAALSVAGVVLAAPVLLTPG